jgi:hypothetical protein
MLITTVLSFWPQLIWIGITLYELCETGIKHGETVEREENVWYTCLVFIFHFTLYIASGMFIPFGVPELIMIACCVVVTVVSGIQHGKVTKITYNFPNLLKIALVWTVVLFWGGFFGI